MKVSLVLIAFLFISCGAIHGPAGDDGKNGSDGQKGEQGEIGPAGLNGKDYIPAEAKELSYECKGHWQTKGGNFEAVYRFTKKLDSTIFSSIDSWCLDKDKERSCERHGEKLWKPEEQNYALAMADDGLFFGYVYGQGAALGYRNGAITAWPCQKIGK